MVKDELTERAGGELEHVVGFVARLFYQLILLGWGYVASKE